MKHNHAANALRVMRILLALMTVAVCLLLCWQAIDIYLTGNRPENFSSPGVRIEPVYSREIVGERFRTFAPFLWIYLAMIFLALLLQAVCAGKPESRSHRRQQAGNTASPDKTTRRRGNFVFRLILFAAALILIFLGIQNGGLRDVLVKAINICTECIGLG